MGQVALSVFWTFLAISASVIHPSVCGSVPEPTLMIDSTTNTVDVGFTKNMTLNCTFVVAPGSDVGGVVSLIVSKANITEESDDHFREIAKINSYPPVTVDTLDDLGGHVTGHLVNQGTSYISYQWYYPSTEAVGRYKCDVFALDMMGRPRYISNTTSVYPGQTPDAVLEALRQCKMSEDVLTMRLNSSVDNSQCAATNDKLVVLLHSSEANQILLLDQLNTTLREKEKCKIERNNISTLLSGAQASIDQLKELQSNVYGLLNTSIFDKLQCEYLKDHLVTALNFSQNETRTCQINTQSLKTQLNASKEEIKHCETLRNAQEVKFNVCISDEKLCDDNSIDLKSQLKSTMGDLNTCKAIQQLFQNGKQACEAQQAQLQAQIDVLQAAKQQQLVSSFAIANQTSEIEQLKARLNLTRDAIINNISSYGGHEYVLSYQVTTDIEKAADLCKSFGGYLAEINDVSEANFITRLIGSVGHNHVETALGATDKGHDGKWTFMTSGVPVTYIKWGQDGGEHGDKRSEGDENDDKHCMFISRKGINPGECNRKYKQFRFVCERPLGN